MKNKNILLLALLAACTCAWAEEPADSMADSKADAKAEAKAEARAEAKAEAKTEKNVRVFMSTDGGRNITVNGAPMPVAAGNMPYRFEFDSLHMDGMMPMMRSKLVKNAPYSAEVISERIQNLPDGNQIVNKTSTMHYRDAAGRTRQETRDQKGELKRISIFDPVDNVSYTLDPKDKKATKISMKPLDIEASKLAAEHGRLAGEKARERIEQLRKDGKLSVVERGDGNGNEVVVKRIERTERDGSPRRVMENVEVRVAQAVNSNVNVELGRLAPLVATAFNDGKWSSKSNTKDMGSKEFDGVKAEGKSRSYDIPAGEVGNKNPITVSSETWTSPELQITVYSKQSDPRSGDRIYRLANLKRSEPAAALFTVPSDYAVKEIATHQRIEKIEKVEKTDKVEKK
jgi:hypothetical protein